MFDIHSLTLINFRSYKGTHKFEFPTANGLYYLTGKNEVEPALGANGAGKSTFLDAITWVLYGRTTRGLKATEVLTWHGTAGAQVVLELTVGDQRYQVKRTQKPNTLLIDGKPVDQKELETFIRLNYAGFSHAVLNPQFGTPFFSLSAGDKLTLFSDFMKLDFWLEKAEDASKLANRLELELTSTQRTATQFEAQLKYAEDDIERLKAEAANYEAERKAQLRDLEAEYDELESKTRKLIKELPKLKEERKRLGKLAMEAVFEVDARKKIRESIIADITELGGQRRALVAQRKELETHLQRLEGLKEGDCPHCDQPLKAKNIEKAVALRVDQLQKLKLRLTKLEDLMGVRTRDLVQAKATLDARTQDHDTLVSDLAAVDQAMLAKKVQIGTAQSVLDGHVQHIARSESAKNPHLAGLENKKQDVQGLRARLDAVIKSVATLESDLVAAQFWIKGFKRIRLTIIEQAFQTLELEVNNCLAQLGMKDWEVSFDIERENKSGGITKGFMVLIKSPTSSQPVKWENWSGGETQRLQLAGDLGLANLIMQQAGLRSELEFFDEPSTHLSPEGMKDLADTLHDRAVNEGKRIWIADHASIASFGAFQGIITARKDGNGSHITQ